MKQVDAADRPTNMTYDTSGQRILTPDEALGNELHGARIAFLTKNGKKALLVEQTKFSAAKGQYVIDHRADKSKIERHVKWDDDHQLADAVRAACEGLL